MSIRTRSLANFGRLRLAVVLCAGFALLASGATSAVAGGKAVLKNGTVLSGDLVPVQGLSKRQLMQKSGAIDVYPILMVDAGYKRYFVSQIQVERAEREAELSRFDSFQLPQRRTSRGLKLEQLGRVANITPFDAKGRRSVTIQTSRGPLEVIQGVRELSPRYVSVEGLNNEWEFGLATTSIPIDELKRMLRTAVDVKNPDERLGIVRFLLQSGLHREALAELAEVRIDFPELSDRIDEVEKEIRRFQAQELLAELRRRKRVGQHRLAVAAARTFPTDLFDAAIANEVRTILDEYDAVRERAERAVFLLGKAESELTEDAERDLIASIRPIIRDQIGWETLDRLKPFLDFADDPSLDARERLALAISGWVVGPTGAETSLDKALALWRGRGLILEFLRSDDPFREDQLLDAVAGLEGVGIESTRRIIEHLPAWADAIGVAPDEIATLRTGAGGVVEPDSSDDGASGTRYAVALPSEYDPNRAYPLIVTLRPSETTIEGAVAWWGSANTSGGSTPSAGQSQRRGYIVVAPDYADEVQQEYGYSAQEHDAVLKVIKDACQRFHIDSDRVFLAGHGMGGEACFDIAMSHPDLFAGVVPISGLARKTAIWNWENVERVPFYIVNGELDRFSLEVNSMVVYRMLKAKFDVIYTEYIGRGYETFYEEIHNIFDWMDRHRRVDDPSELEVEVLRPSEDRFYWLSFDDAPLRVDPTAGYAKRALKVTAKITPGNSIYLQSGARKNTLRLTGDLIKLDQRLRVRSGGRIRFNDFVQPSVKTLLKIFKRTGDRRKTYPVEIVVE
ncbi:carboxylesterase family protein [Stratiformator vulcanicus]|uniref:Alpha/beta hydrolase family protein n=1 Tax=Stratiformator vulcanicus TaxID=2527980 RepID=A0A517R4U1_9PLAN|nr:alpha/beta hydrolase-fold protein [Stratiformator vulcanicus]QDT38843.1 Alpha/beta hydrolase family protein [Stratiformator vulcanicus]